MYNFPSKILGVIWHSRHGEDHSTHLGASLPESTEVFSSRCKLKIPPGRRPALTEFSRPRERDGRRDPAPSPRARPRRDPALAPRAHHRQHGRASVHWHAVRGTAQSPASPSWAPRRRARRPAPRAGRGRFSVSWRPNTVPRSLQRREDASGCRVLSLRCRRRLDGVRL